MKDNNGNLKNLLKDNIKPEIIIKDEITDDNIYIIERNVFESFFKFKIDPYHYKKYKTDFFPKDLDEYTTKYLKGIKEKEILFYLPNFNMMRFQNETKCPKEEKDSAYFRFLTGSEKSGKTFCLLCLNLFNQDERNYRLYLNERYISELENKGEYEEILKIFFYEIAKIFQRYYEYFFFSIAFHKKIKEIIKDKFKFKDILLKFIEEIDVYIRNNKETDNKLMIILDDYELDETEPGKFKENIELVNLLYNKRNERTKIHFTFVSPINNNYIKQCVIYGMELIQNSVTSSLGKIYYPFIYYSTCLFDPYNNLSKDEYKKRYVKKIKEN